MATLFRIIPIVLVWGRHVISAVTIIEAILGSTATGEEKRKAVFEYLAEQATKHGLPWGGAVLDALDTLITAIVWFLNRFGLFQHKNEKTEEELAVEKLVAPSNPARVITHDPELESFLARTAR